MFEVETQRANFLLVTSSLFGTKKSNDEDEISKKRSFVHFFKGNDIPVGHKFT